MEEWYVCKLKACQMIKSYKAINILNFCAIGFYYFRGYTPTSLFKIGKRIKCCIYVNCLGLNNELYYLEFINYCALYKCIFFKKLA